MPWRVRRPAPRIWFKLALAYLVPTALFFAPVAFLAYRTAGTELEAELGKRLASIATSTATQIRGKYLLDLQPGEEQERSYLNTRRKLDAVRAATGVARISVFAPDHTSLCDTTPTPIGERYYTLDADNHELERMFAENTAVSSTLFEGSDGRWYKAGYAPLYADDDEADPKIVGGIRVEAPAEYFERLVGLQSAIKTYSLALAGLYILVSLIVAALIVRPIRRLTRAAERIGQGDLKQPVPVRGRDEIAFLAGTLDEMREALRARNERLQMMLAGIAHEVRNPLGGIELFAGILREELAGDTEKTGHVQRIEREVGHLKAIVSDFLEFARRPKPDLRPTELLPLFDELRDVVAADAGAAGVALRIGAPRALRVAADASQLRRAVLNLLRNAVQATPEGGEVRLQAERADGGQVRVEVGDTGKGIPAEELEKIFAPFYTTKEKGTGLGLAFVREIVADHGGTLDITSEVGRGTTFAILMKEA